MYWDPLTVQLMRYLRISEKIFILFRFLFYNLFFEDSDYEKNNYSVQHIVRFCYTIFDIINYIFQLRCV